MLHFVVQSPLQELISEALAASVLPLQVQTKNVSTYEREIPADSTKAEVIHKSSISALNIMVKPIPLPSSNETVRNFLTGATSAQNKTDLTRDGLENTAAAFRKQDLSNDETVKEFNCKQLKNRTSVSELVFFFFKLERKKKLYFKIKLAEFVLGFPLRVYILS